MRLSFGRCLFDTATRELTVGGKPSHLTLKLFQLLEVLLEQRPRAISKAELHHCLWPESFVSESALSSLIAELRSAIGDDAHESGLIRTIHGHGYAFSGQVSVVSELPTAGSPVCRLLWDRREISLAEGENLLGRMREAVVWIDDPSVSRKHARINVYGDTVTIVDLGSKNGTFLNHHKVEGPQQLADGDTIAVGAATFTFRVYFLEGPTRTSISQ